MHLSILNFWIFIFQVSKNVCTKHLNNRRCYVYHGKNQKCFNKNEFFIKNLCIQKFLLNSFYTKSYSSPQHFTFIHPCIKYYIIIHSYIKYIILLTKRILFCISQYITCNIKLIFKMQFLPDHCHVM